jgi:hypothetical protein
MLDDLLREYYESGESDAPERLRKIIQEIQPLVIRLLAQCVADREIRVSIWAQTIRKVKLGWNHPDLRFNLTRGKPGDATRGFVLAIALHYAYRWLVWGEHPDRFAD